MAKPNRLPQRQDGQTVRCAIYTRKSTEEGLEQEFNSLDAQREACAAYILSQRHEGWVELPALYDDGGYSGGNMDRPGLKQLLSDVDAGSVNVIVLYKVDRLTRSLADFARIVEVLDGAGASFVSVTQSFNTTTSMGRLTLNVLLSFAQFEREVTGERIRDKIAASKAKGMWMGGVVPLGYRVSERKLLVIEEEAATVRMIFERYVQLGSTGDLADELKAKGIVTKIRLLKNGSTGGGAFTRGALAHMLQNRLYVAEITHRDHVYPAEHQPIIERVLWGKVQGMLASNTRQRRTSGASESSLLAGMISDGHGRPMTPTHATKGARRYRYYVTRTEGGDPHRPWSVPAHGIDRLVIERLAAWTGEGTALAARLLAPSSETAELIQQRGAEFGKRLVEENTANVRSTFEKLGLRLQLKDEEILLQLDPQALLELLLGADRRWLALELQDYSALNLTLPVKVRRRGQELRLVFKPKDREAPSQVDATLVELIARGYNARQRLMTEGIGVSAKERAHLTRISRLCYLAPDIVAAIVNGRQPADIHARSLMRAANLPACWKAQRELLRLG